MNNVSRAQTRGSTWWKSGKGGHWDPRVRADVFWKPHLPFERTEQAPKETELQAPILLSNFHFPQLPLVGLVFYLKCLMLFSDLVMPLLFLLMCSLIWVMPKAHEQFLPSHLLESPCTFLGLGICWCSNLLWSCKLSYTQLTPLILSHPVSPIFLIIFVPSLTIP